MNIKAILRQAIRVGLVTVGTGVLLLPSAQLVQAQPDPAAVRRELDLNMSQMRQLRNIMQDYQAELEDILTPEQLEEMQDLREAARQEGAASESNQPSREDIIAELDLSDDQIEQLTEVRESMEEDLEDVLSPQQLEKLEEMGGFGRI